MLAFFVAEACFPSVSPEDGNGVIQNGDNFV
jgi:hypothetical protein